MTITPPFDPAFVAAGEAETFGSDRVGIRLLLDSSATGGALSTLEVQLGVGQDGAAPHYHTRSHELFYVTEGELQVLTGDDLRTVAAGGALVVPKYAVHAFGAAPGASAKVLIVLTPGAERFEYFRLLTRIDRGEATVEELVEAQDIYDNHFVDSPVWRAARMEGRQ
ncbi:cupin domain-containing protein [Mycobacterium sp. CBMA293]|nr:cupin domain-containing protein [Mycolicibacterium sp. CBMA 360]MUL59592.1 cupin domain-containing protein [Mycolicibacterium sp. CBMA 335]MUL71317.1 cupin domain-containing protein [Mycolicibacterium sp. CBMA 311]MUL94960.1 cupin domain-containing protein [Mycolicibacterium sp. CBMA 230]MUM03798.1 cupin [Mycolicibacterium sp. CBMA 213]MUM12080.1 cupin domain-containing protein [Mycolicibacterium sp. CBMA 293]MUM31562.1 cupin domain-containing protein [Mycolicibacterium sp. CBMA 361]